MLNIAPQLHLCYTAAMEMQQLKGWLGAGSINIFGRPFAGKDTQGKKLAELFGGVLMGGGDILRGSIIPDHVKAAMHAGHLIPTEDYIEIVLPYLQQKEFNGKPLILSSVGRWNGEEKGVIEATEEAGHELKAVIYLDLDEDTVRERWQTKEDAGTRGARHDDNFEVLDTRLKEFREKTLPVIDHYRDLGLLIEVDGNQKMNAITSQILAALINLASVSQ